MSRDYARLKSTLANSKLQADNNALYQTILGLISAAQELDASVAVDLSEIEAALAALNASIQVINSDTSSSAQSYDLADYCKLGIMVVVKDISGNAGTNNITLIGTVDGVVDPVLNTNYEVFRVYLGSDNLFHQW